MTGKILTGYRHDLQITGRWTAAGQTRAIVWAGLIAGLVVVGLGL